MATSKNENGAAEGGKKKRKASGPRKIRPICAILGVNQATGKPEVVKASKDASDLLEVFMNPPADLAETYGNTLTSVKIEDESSKAPAPAAAE